MKKAIQQKRVKHIGKRGILAAISLVTVMTITLLTPDIKKAVEQQKSQSVVSTKKNLDVFTPDKVGGMVTVKYTGIEGKTVLELLSAYGNKVETKSSSMGDYVDSINGIKSGTEGKYWLFYVNGEMPTIGADQYITVSGDNVEWKLQ